MNKDLDKYWFKNLEITNAEFKIFLRSVEKIIQMCKMLAEKQKPTPFDPNILDKNWFSSDEVRQIEKLLDTAFINFNSTLQYPLKKIRFKKVKDAFVENFFKLYLPDDRKYQNYIEKAEKAMEQMDYQTARSLYYKAKWFKPGENYPKEQIKKIDEILEQNY